MKKLDLSSFPGGYSVGAIAYVAFFLLAPLVVAALSYKYFEYPFLMLKENRKL